MSRAIRRVAAVVVALALASVTGGLVFSKWYWGYWVSPPTVASWLDELATVESISATYCKPGVPVSVEPIASSDIPKFANLYRRSPADYPNERGFAALVEAGIRTAPATVSRADAQAICDATQAATFLVAAEPGYRYGRHISALLVTGMTASGQHVAILSAKSGELSNDHFGLYDVRFAESPPARWHANAHHVYFEDIAGIEGARWWFAAIVFFLTTPMVLLTLVSVARMAQLAGTTILRLSRGR